MAFFQVRPDPLSLIIKGNYPGLYGSVFPAFTAGIDIPFLFLVIPDGLDYVGMALVLVLVSDENR